MSKKVPYKVAKRVKKAVFEKADEVNYLAQGRSANGQFMEQLVSEPDVGGTLGEYMAKADIKTYIKDAILNRYAKDKKEEANQTSNVEIVKAVFNLETVEIDSDNRAQVTLCKVPDSKEFVVVAEGTHLKWETALRKSMIYAASKPFFSNHDSKILILLKLFARNKVVPLSDKRLLETALARFGAAAYIYGEG